MHSCCKLHSITRRTIRFAGAYLLGLLLVMISCDILATSTGRLRPFFAQDCPSAYHECLAAPSDLVQPSAIRARSAPSAPVVSPTVPASMMPVETPGAAGQSIATPAALVAADQPPETSRIQEGAKMHSLIERKWIDLTGKRLDSVCQFNGGDPDVELKFGQLARSWPSYPAAIFTYACLYVACYLCFVGTARPVRIITCCLVLVTVMLGLIFNVQLVKDHYNHWEDVASAAGLALLVVIFVLYVYLNKFKDFHYYDNQKVHVFHNRSFPMDGSFGNYSTETTLGQYNMNDMSNSGATNNAMQNDETGGSASNNDLAMRYFQIPRANYRGAPRPISAMSQIR